MYELFLPRPGVLYPKFNTVSLYPLAVFQRCAARVVQTRLWGHPFTNPVTSLLEVRSESNRSPPFSAGRAYLGCAYVTLIGLNGERADNRPALRTLAINAIVARPFMICMLSAKPTF